MVALFEVSSFPAIFGISASTSLVEYTSRLDRASPISSTSDRLLLANNAHVAHSGHTTTTPVSFTSIALNDEPVVLSGVDDVRRVSFNHDWFVTHESTSIDSLNVFGIE